MTYISNRFFKLWHYSTSHNILIIRSEKQYEDVEYLKTYEEPKYNVDIEFTGVVYMDLISQFEGIDLKKNSLSIPEKVKKYHNRDLNVYVLNNYLGDSFYVVASNCIIGKSKWELDVDRIINFELEYDSKIEI